MSHYCSHSNDWTVCLIRLVKEGTEIYCLNRIFNKVSYFSRVHVLFFSCNDTISPLSLSFSTIDLLLVGKFHTSNVHVMFLLLHSGNLFLWAIWTTADNPLILQTCTLFAEPQKPWGSVFFPVSYDQHSQTHIALIVSGCLTALSLHWSPQHTRMALSFPALLCLSDRACWVTMWRLA